MTTVLWWRLVSFCFQRNAPRWCDWDVCGPKTVGLFCGSALWSGEFVRVWFVWVRFVRVWFVWAWFALAWYLWVLSVWMWSVVLPKGNGASEITPMFNPLHWISFSYRKVHESAWVWRIPTGNLKLFSLLLLNKFCGNLQLSVKTRPSKYTVNGITNRSKTNAYTNGWTQIS